MVDYLLNASIFNNMVESEKTSMPSSHLNGIFHALSDATRRNMLQELATGEKTVTELAEPYEMSLAAASKHIRVLEHAGLIERRISGRTHHCHIVGKPLANAQAWLSTYERFWTSRLDALDQLLRQEDPTPPTNHEEPEK